MDDAIVNTQATMTKEVRQATGAKIALTAMDPNAPYGNSGQTVQDRINQLLQQRTNVQQMDQQVENLLPLLTPPDLIIYKNRWLMFGEENAQQWVIGKYGQK